MATLATVAAVATIATLIMMASTTEGQIVPQEEVTITNWLDGGLDLSLHCKSKDDDLGKQVLSSKSGWRFRFFPNVFGKTLFFCSFNWAGSGGQKRFDIYKEKRDNCIKCRWVITQKGPCMFSQASNDYTICYPFDS